MTVVEIPREQWADALNAFTVAHEGWIVSLDTSGPDAGLPLESSDWRLIGVSADRSDRDGTITISAALSERDHLTHIIRSVSRIYMERVTDGTRASLLVESAGETTVVQVRATAIAAPGSPRRP